ncbi:hypothetical protein ACO0RG_002374 [Hanseniaspora osmophila]
MSTMKEQVFDNTMKNTMNNDNTTNTSKNIPMKPDVVVDSCASSPVNGYSTKNSEFVKRRKSAPSAFLSSSTEEIVNQMEKEQDRMVITLLREIHHLQYENNVYKQKLASFMDVGSMNFGSSGNATPKNTASTSTNTTQSNYNNYNSSYFHTLPTSSSPLGHGSTGTMSNITRQSSLSRQGSIGRQGSISGTVYPSAMHNTGIYPTTSHSSRQSRSRFNSMSNNNGLGVAGVMAQEESPLTSPMPSRRSSWNKQNVGQNYIPGQAVGQGVITSVVPTLGLNRRRSSSSSYNTVSGAVLNGVNGPTDQVSKRGHMIGHQALQHEQEPNTGVSE